MYSIEIPFKDFLGQDRIGKYTFHLSESELLELEYKTGGELRRTLNVLSEGTENTVDLAGFFAMFIKAAYGEMSPDGLTFDKTEEIWNRFYRSNAYNELFMKVMTDDNSAIDLINGSMPKTE